MTKVQKWIHQTVRKNGFPPPKYAGGKNFFVPKLCLQSLRRFTLHSGLSSRRYLRQVP